MEADETVDAAQLFERLWRANRQAELLALPHTQRHALERWLRQRAELRAAAAPLTRWCAPAAAQRPLRATDARAMFARTLLAALEAWSAEGGARAGARRADAARIAATLALRACDSLAAARALLARALALADARACSSHGGAHALFPAAGAAAITDPWAPVGSTQLLAPSELRELRFWAQLLRIRADVSRRGGEQGAVLRDARTLLDATQLYDALQALSLDVAPCPAALQLLALSGAPDAPLCARLRLDTDAASEARHAWDAYLTTVLQHSALRGVHDVCAAVAAAARELPRDAPLPELRHAARWLHALGGGDSDGDDGGVSVAEARVNALCAAVSGGDFAAVGAMLLALLAAAADDGCELVLPLPLQGCRFALPRAQQVAALTAALAALHAAAAAAASAVCAAAWPATPAPAPERDQGGWASLPHDLVRRVLHHLLAPADADAAAHFRLRRVCAAWRAATPGGRDAWRAWCAGALCGRWAKAAHAPGLSRAQLVTHRLLLRHLAAATKLTNTGSPQHVDSMHARQELQSLALLSITPHIHPLARRTAALAAAEDAPALLLRVHAEPHRGSAAFAALAPPGAHASVAGAWLELRFSFQEYPLAPPGVTLRGALDGDALPIMTAAELDDEGALLWPAHMQHDAASSHVLNHVAAAAALLAASAEAPAAAAARVAAHGCLTLAAALGAPPAVIFGANHADGRPMHRDWPTLPLLLALLLARQRVTVVLPALDQSEEDDDEDEDEERAPAAAEVADMAALRAHVWATSVAPARAALVRMLRCGRALCALAAPDAAAAAAALAAARHATPLEATLLNELREWECDGDAAVPPSSFWPGPVSPCVSSDETSAAEERWALARRPVPAAASVRQHATLAAAMAVPVTVDVRFCSLLEEHGVCSAASAAATRRALRRTLRRALSASAPRVSASFGSHVHAANAQALSDADLEEEAEEWLQKSLHAHVLPLPMRRRVLLELAAASAACGDARAPALDLQLLTMVNAAAGTRAAEALLSAAAAAADAGGGAGSLAAWVGLQ
jgi:hypothetical protein